MRIFIPRRLKTGLEALLWAGIFTFAAYRFGPQVGAALGIGGAEADAPSYETETLEGQRVSLAQLRGQVVLVNFWASWCGPCRLEMPGFQDVFEDYQAQGFTILGISRDAPTDESKVRAFLADKDITYPVALEDPRSRDAFGQFGALPTSFLIDKEGRIRHRVEGIFLEPTLRMAVKKLLSES